MTPSYSDLTYFVEVAETQNLTRAAERLGIAQPSLTLAMKRLEDTIGTQLIHRSKRGVSLTQGGKQLLGRSRALLRQWEAIKSEALASVDQIQGSYKIGCHQSVALYALPTQMAELMAEHPDLEIKLVHNLSRVITEQVIQSEIELGIVVNPINHPDLVIRKLCEDEVTFWVGPGKKTQQQIDSGEAVLICDPELLQSQQLLKKLKKNQIEFKRVVPSSSLEVITELVASGTGIGILPGRVAAQASAQLSPVPGTPLYRDKICLLYRVENRNLRTIKVMAEKFSELV